MLPRLEPQEKLNRKLLVLKEKRLQLERRLVKKSLDAKGKRDNELLEKRRKKRERLVKLNVRLN